MKFADAFRRRQGHSRVATGQSNVSCSIVSKVQNLIFIMSHGISVEYFK